MQQLVRLVPSSAESLQAAELIRRAAFVRGDKREPVAPRALSLTIRGLRKSFGSNEVLRGIDLHIPAGQFVAIVGRSGCGKSTLLRLIAGLDKPTGGTIEFGNHEGSPSDHVRVMFQEPRLLPWARVLSSSGKHYTDMKAAPAIMSV